jgi:rRNA processing protein Krr1/Pno1
MIDHINGDTSNNNIDNLRIVNNQQNQYNRNRNGYCYHKLSKKWQATIRFDNKTKYLGIFNTEEEARQAYQTAKAKYHVIAT